ncbi:response regulator [Aestuariirhabdus sp. Z084]|uniref:response regulator n=1 Tax=Aestuariirhabdus haliotis TaxID=2918751 RepID=UPI00201B430D|nr:response regulator [Aestuariirhabdus haliotis]MCL6415846.1 response regulator [Aestuariirhabdus haliotis]MCL6419852.1 response regulator [Aestuariirhabdus haliotis]
MKKLLIVDDSEIIRTQIRQCFKDSFSAIHVAKNGKDAVDKVKAVQPDIITMDLTMPEMDGIKCIDEMMKIDDSLKILVISALSDNATCIQALKLGAQGFLDKPFGDKELKEAIQIMLEEG